jgi:hypothetical protein
MLTGVIQLSAFEYKVADGELGENGSQKTAIKIFMIKDKHSGLQIQLIMKPEELDALGAKLLDSRIIPASSIPRA